MRRLAVLLVSALLTITACTPQQADAWLAVNETRIAHGARPLYWDQALADIATARANELARNGQLDHLPWAGFAWPDGWQLIGENVGLTSGDVMVAYLASPLHRSVLLGDWDRTGIGIATADGHTYYVHLFLRID